MKTVYGTIFINDFAVAETCDFFICFQTAARNVIQQIKTESLTCKGEKHQHLHTNEFQMIPQKITTPSTTSPEVTLAFLEESRYTGKAIKKICPKYLVMHNHTI